MKLKTEDMAERESSSSELFVKFITDLREKLLSFNQECEEVWFLHIYG